MSDVESGPEEIDWQGSANRFWQLYGQVKGTDPWRIEDYDSIVLSLNQLLNPDDPLSDFRDSLRDSARDSFLEKLKIRGAYESRWNTFDSALEVAREEEVAARVQYQPDGSEVNRDQVARSLLMYIYRAAAVALLLKNRDGHSEDVRDTFANAWRARHLLSAEYWDDAPQWGDFLDAYFAVDCFLALELFRLRLADGEYEDAVSMLALGLDEVDANLIFLFDPFGTRLTGMAVSDLKEGLKGISTYPPDVDFEPAQAQRAIDALLSSPAKANWGNVAADCGEIARTGEVWLKEDQKSLRDSTGQWWKWHEYWLRASGLAEAKLQPSELAEFHKRLEEDRAEEILRAYFFEHRVFDSLPELVKRSLIEATRSWTWARRGRPENVLNEVRIAVEGLLYYVLWEPIEGREKYVKDNRPRRFRDIRDSTKEKGHSPRLVHYKELLKDEWVIDLIKGSTLDKNWDQRDKDLLLKKLPGALARLTEERNQAEHPIPDRESKVGREEITPVLKSFLGIGEEGILPRLAELYFKSRQAKTA